MARRGFYRLSKMAQESGEEGAHARQPSIRKGFGPSWALKHP